MYEFDDDDDEPKDHGGARAGAGRKKRKIEPPAPEQKKTIADLLGIARPKQKKTEVRNAGGGTANVVEGEELIKWSYDDGDELDQDGAPLADEQWAAAHPYDYLLTGPGVGGPCQDPSG